MKFLKIFQLEFNYQLRKVSTWLYLVVTMVLAFLFIQGNYVHDAREGYFLVNGPIVVASSAVLSCVFWLLIGAAVAGGAAARDVHTRMFSLTYTSPTGKADYLGGRFLAALALNVFILLGIPAGLLIAIHFSGVEANILGPFRAATYFNSFFYIVLPNAFIATAIQFSLAALSRRVMAGYLGGGLLFVTAYILGGGVQDTGEWAILVDPMSLTPIMDYLTAWSPLERNTRLISPEGYFLANRLIWLGISLAALAFTWFRFRFTAPRAGRSSKQNISQAAGVNEATSLRWDEMKPLPGLRGTFSFATRLHQLKFLTLNSFFWMAKKWYGLPLLAFIALVIAAAMPGNLKTKGVPMLPGTDQVLNVLTAPLTDPGKFWMVIFLLTVFYAGELVWRERETGLNELSDAAPLPEWILFLSKFLSLSLMLIFCLAFLLLAGVLAQIAIGGADVESGLYLKALFGFQLIECLLFILLALVLQVMINQKYLGHLIALLFFGCMMYASSLGLEHKLLIFGASPPWSYTTMGGFGLSVLPWLWFKIYWAAWSLLLAVMARLLWVRSRELGLSSRLQLARRRFTGTTALTSAMAAGMILISGGFIFYNTNILNEYTTSSEISAGRALYEQRYGKYFNIPQPSLVSVDLQVEIYPDKHEFGIKGTYLLVNKQLVSIDSVHLAIPEEVETRSIGFSRSAIAVLADKETGFFIYALGTPLQPGDTLKLDFRAHHQTEGFTNSGAEDVISSNFVHIRNFDRLPVVGYQPYRELDDAAARKQYGLDPRPATASLYNLEARKYGPFTGQVSFNAVVGTAENHTVAAPGTLRKTWKKGSRNYFHYATDTPIREEIAIFSANYAVHKENWSSSKNPGNSVAIQVYHHPGHTGNLYRMVQSVKASLDYYTSEFGPYPYRQLRFVATPGLSGGNHAAPINITAEEGFFLLNTKQDERGFDLVTAVVAHEVAHQWWGNQLRYAYVEGAGLLSESLAWYSAMGVLEDKYGPGHLQKLLSFLREEYEAPRSRAAAPLLQSTDWYHNYRKGPFAVYALSQYIGKDRVNAALSRLLQKHSPGKGSLATSLDLYQELHAVTPDSLRYLLHDLFKANTFWDIEAKQATVKQAKAGVWQVTFNVQVRKTVVSETGLEKKVPLKDWIEIGIFATAKKGDELGKPIYFRKHFFDSEQQTITVTVPSRPSKVGIDPNHLLVDWDIMNNFAEVKN